jgi:hypothetical protein
MVINCPNKELEERLETICREQFNGDLCIAFPGHEILDDSVKFVLRYNGKKISQHNVNERIFFQQVDECLEMIIAILNKIYRDLEDREFSKPEGKQ